MRVILYDAKNPIDQMSEWGGIEVLALLDVCKPIDKRTREHGCLNI